MKLKDARNAYDCFSGKLSEIVRQLSFAGIAVVWMFKSGSGGISFDERLVWPLRLFVVALAMDLLHYAYASLAWGRYADTQEKHGAKDEDEVSPSHFINWPSLFFFWGKSLVCVIAYAVMIICLWSRI